MGIRVVTDSSAVIPPAWRSGLPIHVVPLQIAWPGGEAGSDRPYSELAERLDPGPPPKTSAPSPGAYEELFGELLGADETLLVVCPASELSTTYGNAVLAARSAGEHRVYVLDARTAAAGQGIVAVEAAAAAAEGRDIEGVLQHALDVASRVQIWATLLRLDHLRRSGRVPAVAAVGAGALRLQPIVRYAGGSPTPVGVSRSPSRAAERLFRAFERSSGDRLRLVAFHSARGDEAIALRDRVLQRAPHADTAVVEVMASLAAHTGPGLLGLAWLWEPLHS